MAQESKEEFWLFGYGSLIWKPPPHFDRRIPGFVEGYVRRFWQASEDHRGTPEAPVRAPAPISRQRDNINFAIEVIGYPLLQSEIQCPIMKQGRVVTLIERSFWESLDDRHTTPESRVWGTAYRISPEHVAEVKDYLDIREINGYSIQYAPFVPASDSGSAGASTANDGKSNASIRCLVYIGLPGNPQFMGVQEPQALAAHILRSKGPSGENKEYLYALDRALAELGLESGDAHVEDLARRVRELETALDHRKGNEGGDEGDSEGG